MGSIYVFINSWGHRSRNIQFWDANFQQAAGNPSLNRPFKSTLKVLIRMGSPLQRSKGMHKIYTVNMSIVLHRSHCWWNATPGNCARSFNRSESASEKIHLFGIFPESEKGEIYRKPHHYYGTQKCKKTSFPQTGALRCRMRCGKNSGAQPVSWLNFGTALRSWDGWQHPLDGSWYWLPLSCGVPQ